MAKLTDVWRCDITGNPVGTDTRMIGAPPCDCQGCRAEAEIAKLRRALLEQRIKPGVRVVIAHLHKRAAEMNHYPAKQWLNSLGFELGVYLKNGHLNTEAAIDATLPRGRAALQDGRAGR